jgi:TPR repeat protein
MSFLLSALLAVMAPADAVVTLLNSPSSSSPAKYENAKAIVEKDAAEGKPVQQFVIGVLFEDHKSSRKYLKASRAKIRMMAEKKNNPLAWYLLSLESNDLAMLRKAAAGGNVQALNALGTIATAEALGSQKLSSDDIAKILKKCFGYFGQAAAMRDANGFINLGACYMRGLGCTPDPALAFECFRSAAELGHPEGMDNMSACYELGHGVKKNEELSLLWKMRGRALRGDKAAARWLRDRKKH